MDDQSKGRVEWPEGAWRLRVRFDMPLLNVPAVQYGVFCEDPTLQFAPELHRAERALLLGPTTELSDAGGLRILIGKRRGPLAFAAVMLLDAAIANFIR